MVVYVDNTDPARPATPMPDADPDAVEGCSGEQAGPTRRRLLAPLPDWQRATLERRARACSTGPTPRSPRLIKRTVQPYFVLRGQCRGVPGGQVTT